MARNLHRIAFVLFIAVAGLATPASAHAATYSRSPSSEILTPTSGTPDVLRGTTELVSQSTAGAVGIDYAVKPSISADGRLVAFASFSANLVAGDTNSVADIFIRDRGTGTTTRVSLGDLGQEPDRICINPYISADGRFVVFSTEATNLGYNGYGFEVYLRDLVNQTTEQISVTTNRSDSTYGAYASGISGDGRLVVFDSQTDYTLVTDDDNGFGDVFVRDALTDTTEIVSLSDDEQQGNGWSHSASISADGRYVAFVSSATNLTDDGGPGVFVRDRLLGTTTRVDVSDAGEPANGYTARVSISADGTTVAFETAADNLCPNDVNRTWDVFVRDLVEKDTTCVSLTPTGSTGDFWSQEAVLSADGARVAFTSDATNLVVGDVNGRRDVFVRDIGEGATKRVSVTNSREEAEFGGGGSSAGIPSIDASGDVVAFAGLGSSYGAYGGWDQVMARDLLATATVEQVATHDGDSAEVILDTYGEGHVIDGQLLTGEGALGEMPLTIEPTASARSFASVLTAATTLSDGRYAVSVSPISKTTYAIRPALGGLWSARSTRSVTVVPRAYVRTPVAPSRVRRSRHFTVYGWLKPRHPRGTYPVRIYRWKKTTSGRWKSHGYVKAKAYNHLSYTQYKRSIRLTSSGTWRLRAYAPADSGHAASWSSGYDYVAVR